MCDVVLRWQKTPYVQPSGLGHLSNPTCSSGPLQLQQHLVSSFCLLSARPETQCFSALTVKCLGIKKRKQKNNLSVAFRMSSLSMKDEMSFRFGTFALFATSMSVKISSRSKCKFTWEGFENIQSHLILMHRCCDSDFILLLYFHYIYMSFYIHYLTCRCHRNIRMVLSEVCSLQRTTIPEVCGRLFCECAEPSEVWTSLLCQIKFYGIIKWSQSQSVGIMTVAVILILQIALRMSEGLNEMDRNFALEKKLYCRFQLVICEVLLQIGCLIV